MNLNWDIINACWIYNRYTWALSVTAYSHEQAIPDPANNNETNKPKCNRTYACLPPLKNKIKY